MSKESILPILQQVRNELLSIKYFRPNYPGIRKTLRGWCVLSSYVLFHILRKKGYSPTFARSACHAFVICEGYYIDVTLEQFNYSFSDDCVRYWTPYNRQHNFPEIYLEQKPSEGEYHLLAEKTEAPKEILNKVCRHWNVQVGHHNPVIINLIKTL